MRESSKSGPGEQRLSKYKIGHWWQRSGEKKKIYIYIERERERRTTCKRRRMWRPFYSVVSHKRLPPRMVSIISAQEDCKYHLASFISHPSVCLMARTQRSQISGDGDYSWGIPKCSNTNLERKRRGGPGCLFPGLPPCGGNLGWLWP